MIYKRKWKAKDGSTVEGKTYWIPNIGETAICFATVLTRCRLAGNSKRWTCS
jgi:hypothetical protein